MTTIVIVTTCSGLWLPHYAFIDAGTAACAFFSFICTAFYSGNLPQMERNSEAHEFGRRKGEGCKVKIPSEFQTGRFCLLACCFLMMVIINPLSLDQHSRSVDFVIRTEHLP